MRTIDDEKSQIEASVLRWAERTRREVRIDALPLLDGQRVAVVTDLRSGRQGLWPRAWDVPAPEPLESLPLFATGPKKQRTLF